MMARPGNGDHAFESGKNDVVEEAAHLFRWFDGPGERATPAPGGEGPRSFSKRGASAGLPAVSRVSIPQIRSATQGGSRDGDGSRLGAAAHDGGAGGEHGPHHSGTAGHRKRAAC